MRYHIISFDLVKRSENLYPKFQMEEGEVVALIMRKEGSMVRPVFQRHGHTIDLLILQYILILLFPSSLKNWRRARSAHSALGYTWGALCNISYTKSGIAKCIPFQGILWSLFQISANIFAGFTTKDEVSPQIFYSFQVLEFQTSLEESYGHSQEGENL